MQFIKDKDYYKIVRITGPTHNLLAIRLSAVHVSTQVTPLPIHMSEEAHLEPREVLEQVLLGLAEVNQELGRQYYLSEIQFVPSDAKPSSGYHYLIKALIQRIDGGEDFIVV